jgi:predicted DNA-binding ribbon-helix-helix protein
MEISQKNLTLLSGKRTGLKVDAATWQAIDYLAGQRGITWQDWCRAAIERSGTDENITGTVRAAVTNDLMMASVLDGRGESLETIVGHTLMHDSATLNDGQWGDIMKTATVQGSEDFGGYAVFFGHDESGQECIWIRNGLRNGLHFAIIYPNKA